MVARKPKAVPTAPGWRFWLFMACCGLGAITLVVLLIGGEIQGERVAPNIEQQSNARSGDSND
jgi:hypothetical protein